MLKKGFTLAEVLITLGIVGVVSALVLPTFTTKMQTAKVGPRLAKAVAAFEQANIAILNDNGTDSLAGVDGPSIALDCSYCYMEHLKNHMKGSMFDDGSGEGGRFMAADGVSYCMTKAKGRTPDTKCIKIGFELQDGKFPHLNPVAGFKDTAFMIDIDGENGPGQIGRDLFFFQMMEDGSLRPWGGSWEEEKNRWNFNDNCPKNGKPKNYALCAGHIFENGLKVEYK